jgi:hypothetical protein
MHTNLEWVSQYSRHAHQWDDVFPTGIFHSAKSSGPLSHNYLHTHTSDLQQFEIYQDAIEQTTVTQCIQTFSRPFGHGLIIAGLAKLWKSLEGDGLSKVEPSNGAYHVRSPTSSFPTTLTWDGIHLNFTSIPFWHRLKHNCLHSYTRGWVWFAIFLDNIDLIEHRLSVRIRHLSGGRNVS